MSFEIGTEISSQMSFKILTGMLIGPLDFDAEKDLIILMISSGLTDWRKIDLGHLGLLFFRKLERLLEGGMVDLTFSVIELKN